MGNLKNTIIEKNEALYSGGGVYIIGVNVHELETLDGCKNYATSNNLPFHSDTYSNGITPKGCWKTAGKIYFNNNDKSVVQCDAPGLMCPPGFKTGAVCYAHNMCA